MLKLNSKLLPAVVLAGILPFSLPSFAKVTLTVPGTVDMLAVNAKEPALSMSDRIFSSNKTLELPDGVNQIVFQYHPNITQGNDIVQIDTDIIIAKFNATDTDLTFELPKYRNEREARKFDQNPDWKLLNDEKQAIEIVQDKLLNPGIQIGRDYEEEAKAYNQKGGIAAIRMVETAPKAEPQKVAATTSSSAATTASATNSAAVATTTAAVTASAAVPKSKTKSTSTPQATQTQAANVNPAKTYQVPAKFKNTEEEMLYYWYQKADPTTKANFLKAVSTAK